jgi:hypothetical protein
MKVKPPREAIPIALPSAEELNRPDVFLIHPANREIVQKTGRGVYRFPVVLWLLAFFSALCSAFCFYTVVDELPRSGIDVESGILLIFTVLFLIPIVPALSKTRRHRALLRRGQVIKGVGQCTAVEVVDEHEAYWYVTMRYVFVAPDGTTVRKGSRELVSGDLSRWPTPGSRVQIAILYAGPQLFTIL